MAIYDLDRSQFSSYNLEPPIYYFALKPSTHPHIYLRFIVNQPISNNVHHNCSNCNPSGTTLQSSVVNISDIKCLRLPLIRQFHFW